MNHDLARNKLGSLVKSVSRIRGTALTANRTGALPPSNSRRFKDLSQKPATDNPATSSLRSLPVRTKLIATVLPS